MVPIPPPLRRMAPYDIILVTYSATSLLDLLVAHDLLGSVGGGESSVSNSV